MWLQQETRTLVTALFSGSLRQINRNLKLASSRVCVWLLSFSAVEVWFFITGCQPIYVNVLLLIALIALVALMSSGSPHYRTLAILESSTWNYSSESQNRGMEWAIKTCWPVLKKARAHVWSICTWLIWTKGIAMAYNHGMHDPGTCTHSKERATKCKWVVFWLLLHVHVCLFIYTLRQTVMAKWFQSQSWGCHNFYYFQRPNCIQYNGKRI